MSHSIRYPADQIGHLIIEKLAPDAGLHGSDSPYIEIAYEGPALEVEDAFAIEEESLSFRGDQVRRVGVPEGVALTVRMAQGDVRVQGVAGEVNLEDVRGDVRLQDLTGVVRLAQVGADLRADNVNDFRLIGTCNGDLRVDGCHSLAAEMVTGDVRVHDVGDVRLSRVRGDLWLDAVRGAAQINRVSGDARVREIHGPAVLRNISGDLRAMALLGGMSAQQVHGDATLGGPFTATHGYELSADGDIALNLPAESDARLTVRAGGRIRSDIQLTPSADGSPNFAASLGRGSGRISVVAGGNVRVAQPGGRDHPPTDVDTMIEGLGDLRNLGDRIRQQVTASLAAAGIMSAGQEPSSRRATARPTTPPRPRPPAAPPSTEEQVAILKMIQTGQITPEEGDLLLQALES